MIEQIKRYEEVKALIEQLENEKKELHKEIKKELMKVNNNKIVADGIEAKLSFYDHRKFKDDAMDWLRQNGYSELIVEVIDTKLFAQYKKLGKISADEIDTIKKGTLTPYLYVKNIKK